MVTRRDNLICPECNEQSIEEHPSATEYSDESTALIKGSQCGNDDCELELVPASAINVQVSETLDEKKSFVDRLKQSLGLA